MSTVDVSIKITQVGSDLPYMADGYPFEEFVCFDVTGDPTREQLEVVIRQNELFKVTDISYYNLEKRGYYHVLDSSILELGEVIEFAKSDIVIVDLEAYEKMVNEEHDIWLKKEEEKYFASTTFITRLFHSWNWRLNSVLAACTK